MGQETLTAVLRHLRTLRAAEANADLHDNELLERFTTGKEESAFTLLVQRHGPMVLGVCHRVLQDQHAAEDAFQATFLVLIRRAAAVRSGSLASWLYGVAQRVALHARARARGQRNRERRVLTLPTSDVLDELTWQELRTVLDEEIGALPERLRAPIVLCHLEGKSYSAAARELGVPKSSLARRLERARHLLRERLSRRGMTLSAGALAIGLVERASGASLPALLTLNTVKGAVLFAAGKTAGAGALSVQAVALAEESMRGMLGLKTKGFAVMLLAGIVAGGTGLTAYESARQQPVVAAEADAHEATARAGDKPGPRANKQLNVAEPATMTVAGRVLDPDGRPIAGARLYAPGWLKEPVKEQDKLKPVQVGTSDREGRFNLKLPRRARQMGTASMLVAASSGYGLDWTELPEAGDVANLMLRLVRDVPIRGRFISLEGKPVAGIKIAVIGVDTLRQPDNFLDALRHEWNSAFGKRLGWVMAQLLHPTATDAAGRFEIRGAGSDRFVCLDLSESNPPRLLVVTRENADIKAINGADASHSVPGTRWPAYGPSFDHVAEPGRLIEGTVREAATGKPVSGARVVLFFGNPINTVTDALGRYRVFGRRDLPGYALKVHPPANVPLVGRNVQIKAARGAWEAIKADVELPSGIIAKGRVFDRATGRGVISWVSFQALTGNKPGERESDDLCQTTTDGEGRFGITFKPGPGVLTARATGARATVNGVSVGFGPVPYRHAHLSPQDRKRGPESLSSMLRYAHAYKMLEVEQGATTLACDLTMETGSTVKVNIEDPDGKPLTGARVWGITDEEEWGDLKRSSFSVHALDPDDPRQVVIKHVDRRLATVVTLRGDEKQPLTIRVGRAAVLTGVAIDRERQPFQGASVLLRYAMCGNNRLFSPETTAGPGGRYRLDCIVPGLEFDAIVLRTPHQPPKGMRLRSGEVVDIGTGQR